MFGPQGTGFFLFLLVVFGGLLVWVALAKQVVFRVLAACLAFLPAMVFGIAAVNKFYDYYQTWGGMISDLTGQGVSSIPKYAAAGVGPNKNFDKNIGRVTSQAEDAQVGYLFQTSVTDARPLRCKALAKSGLIVLVGARKLDDGQARQIALQKTLTRSSRARPA